MISYCDMKLLHGVIMSPPDITVQCCHGTVQCPHISTSDVRAMLLLQNHSYVMLNLDV